MSERRSTDFVPALGLRFLTPLYDRVIAATLKEQKFKAMLVQQLGLTPGFRVLDLGCGTATLTIMIKRACPEARVTGLDGDSEMLAMARAKVEESGLAIELVEGLAWEPPGEPGSFDAVVSSLVFHHLSRPDKIRTLAALFQALEPGGAIHIADWGRAQNLIMRLAFIPVQLFDGFATTGDNVRGKLPDLLEEAGFVEVQERHHEATVFGTLALYSGRKPGLEELAS